MSGPDQPSAPSTRRAARQRLEEQRAAVNAKAGRDLPMAIGVGAVLLGLVLVGLFLLPPLLLCLAIAVAAIGGWEIARAIQAHTGTPVPLVPLIFGAVAMPAAAWFSGMGGLGMALAGSAVLAVLWNVVEGRRDAARSIGASLLILAWVPLLLSFVFLMLREPRGELLITTLLLLVVSNDTFGYIVGATWGKHPMAPKISPKKSWEGFAGSVVGAVVVGVLVCLFLLNVSWWIGIPLAVATVVASTAGDLAESMVKRELGIKDMSNLLPGHGGVMDRLDSIVFALPVGYLITVAFIGG